jgi:hypothetical protein
MTRFLAVLLALRHAIALRTDSFVRTPQAKAGNQGIFKLTIARLISTMAISACDLNSIQAR